MNYDLAYLWITKDPDALKPDQSPLPMVGDVSYLDIVAKNAAEAETKGHKTFLFASKSSMKEDNWNVLSALMMQTKAKLVDFDGLVKGEMGEVYKSVHEDWQNNKKQNPKFADVVDAAKAVVCGNGKRECESNPLLLLDFDVVPNLDYKPENEYPKLAEVSAIGGGSRKYDCSIMLVPQRDDISDFPEIFGNSSVRMFKSNMAIVSTFDAAMRNHGVSGDEQLRQQGTIGEDQGFAIQRDSSWKQELSFPTYEQAKQSLENVRSAGLVRS